MNITSRTDFLKLGGKYHFNAPLSKLTGDYLVKTKNTNVYQNEGILQIKYEYELSNNYDTENEINYFDNQRAKSEGNISQREYIARNVDIENTTNIVFSNLSIIEVEVTGDNILDSVLDSPLGGIV